MVNFVITAGIRSCHLTTSGATRPSSRVSCQKGPTRHAYAWLIGPFWQDTLELWKSWHHHNFIFFNVVIIANDKDIHDIFIHDL